MPTASTHTPADIVAAFERVGRQITRDRAAAVAGLILQHGYEAAAEEGRKLLSGPDAQLGLDMREYVEARFEAAGDPALLIARLQHEAALLRRPHPYDTGKRAEMADRVEARIGRLVAAYKARADRRAA